MLTSSGIWVESYVQGSDGTLIPFEELTPEQKRRAATELKTRWLNELFAGRATVFPTEEKEGKSG